MAFFLLFAVRQGLGLFPRIDLKCKVLFRKTENTILQDPDVPMANDDPMDEPSNIQETIP